jgi:retron-type reverse transcriptase
MARLATRIKDKRVLKLIRGFLTAGLMIGGLEKPTIEGVPQGGPLSPILWKTIKRFRERVRKITARRRGRSIRQVIDELNSFMRGWWAYYGITESYNRLRPLDHWIRRRLRAVIWKHWKNRKTRVGELLKRGVSRAFAVTTGCARKGPWRMSKVKWVNIALPDAHFESLGLVFPWT